MKKYLILFNNMTPADGVFRSACSLANLLAEQPDTEVTLRPIFKFTKDSLELIDKRIIVKPKYKFYFKGFKRLFSLIPNKLLYKMMVKGKYDVEIGFCIIIPHRAISASKNKEAEHIIWTHGYEYHDFYKKADKVMCVSYENVERMKKDINNAVPVYPCLNIMDEKKIISSSMEPIDLVRNDSPLFVSVARLSPEKGYKRLIEIVNRLVNEDGYKMQLWLVGDGPQTNELKQLCKKYALEDVVTFCGSQINPHKFTKKADCFVLPSYGEGYSTSSAEAIVVGKPVITTNVGGAKEIIESANSGLIVENTDEGLYQGMKKVLDNPEILKEWEKETLKNREKFFSQARKQAILDALKA